MTRRLFSTTILPGVTVMAMYGVTTMANLNGEHELHTMACFYLSQPQHCRFHGEFKMCEEAIVEARKHLPKVNACFSCSRKCHQNR